MIHSLPVPTFDGIHICELGRLTLGHPFVCTVRKHQDTCSGVVYRWPFSARNMHFDDVKNTMLSMSLNSAFISPLNDMNFSFLCRQMSISGMISAVTNVKF